ncbi:MAG: adenine deaminase [Candidatus Latescibacteria bacterium]|nr:adenine deaminase [Candidatus Latescibacterota bacterium]
MKRLISVARGNAAADLVLANARIVNTFSGEVEEGDIAVCKGRIAGIGEYGRAEEVIDLAGKYVSPGLINGHIHPESSMLHITRYAEAVVPRGVSGIVTDLHEITNVKGLDGAKYILDCARDLPLDLYFMVPSCVPATHLETAGARLTADDISTALTWEGSIGLGEMMNYPGVLSADDEVLAKISAAAGTVIDGHSPGVGGRDLNAYIACGIDSDHESTSLEEAREKLRRGMYVMIREGSSEKNLEELLPLVTDRTYKRCLFVVDDRNCADLLRDGEIDAVVRKAIALGMDPVRAIQLATINAADRFRLRDVGAVAPGYHANLVVMEDPSRFEADMVFYRGRLVARDSKPLFPSPSLDDSSHEAMTRTMNVKPFESEALRIPTDGWSHPVIGIVPDQIITRKLTEEAKVENGLVVADIDRDILKLAVVERHRATGNIGLGLVKGFGLKRGALASSVGHDSHNIISVGTNDGDMYAAIREVERVGGGLVAVAEGTILGTLPLPIAGLLSDEPLSEIVEKLEKLEITAKELGTALSAPFDTLSFLALPVIPELRLTDKGLVDVLEFKLLE